MLTKVIVAAGLLVCLSACILYVLGPLPAPRVANVASPPDPVSSATTGAQDRYFANGNLVVWWDRGQMPGLSTMSLTKLSASNIHPDDYAGAESCQKCHAKNYASWSEHPHRWMNALATSRTVRGDFSGPSISYLGGQATFQMEGDQYRMRFERDSVVREYQVIQTIGSRFFQYYVGKLHQGPEPADHPAYAINHVLPFGYWLDRQEWVPAVHVGYDEAPDGKREDPFARHLPPSPLSPYHQCNSCHTTFALGDELARNFHALGRHAPYAFDFMMPDYLRQTHGSLMPAKASRQFGNTEVEALLIGMQQSEASEHAVTLGVSCEACHLGCKQHADGKLQKPSFIPASPHLNARTASMPTGREHANVNWTCGRCHAGERPYYAGGMSTWNSTEYTDATKGSCYSKLTCIHCHNPHESTGQHWSRSAQEDDASCLTCHQELSDVSALEAHTHHPAGSAGSHCMDCHMPRINEGLQNVVRTHTIFSPTNAAMMEANQLNACNICHVEKPIDWTLRHLKKWYGASFDEAKIAEHYPRREQSTILGWLTHKNEAVRLAATDAMARSQDTTALSAWIDVLDDPYLLNRQFARVGIEERFRLKLLDDGYRFYMTPEERREPIERVRRRLMSIVPE